MNGVYSVELVLNTGAPQGCVLSPILFSIYTNSHSSNIKPFKCADDMSLAGLLLKDEATHEEAYLSQYSVLQDWCLSRKLEINVVKTK